MNITKPVITNHKQQNQIRTLFEFILPFIVVAVLWEFVIRMGWVQLHSLPAPSKILVSFWELTFQKGVLFHHFISSLYRLAIGYLMAVIVGTTAGALLSMNQRISDYFEIILRLLISVPTLAWVPVLLITLGLGSKTVIAAIFLSGFFAITYNTMRGIEMIDRSIVRAARIMGVRGIRLFIKVLFPASMNSIITGLRLAIGYGWRALIGGEMLSVMIPWGIGKMVYQARFWNDVTVMFVGMVLIGLSGYLLDRTFIFWLESKTIEKWGVVVRR